MATTPAVTSERGFAAEYARLEERILARDQIAASQVLYGLLKQGRPVTEITRETVRIHAPYTHVPYHQRLDDGIVKFVNNDHCLLSERVGLPLASMIRPELRWLPLAQTVWYMPTGLDPWNQLIGKAPGHYTRLYDIKVNTTPPMPEAHWPDQEPLPVEGTLRERLNHWLTLVQRGEVLTSYRVFLGLMEDLSIRRAALAQLAFAGLIDVQDRMLHHRAGRGARLGACAQRALRGRSRHRRRSALVLDLRDGLQRRPEPARRARRSAAGAGLAAHGGRGGDAGRRHHARARMVGDRGSGRAARGRPRAAPDPGRHPGGRRAGHPRHGRAQQLLDGAARLRVLQHGRLVLRHLP